MDSSVIYSQIEGVKKTIEEINVKLKKIGAAILSGNTAFESGSNLSTFCSLSDENFDIARNILNTSSGQKVSKISNSVGELQGYISSVSSNVSEAISAINTALSEIMKKHTEYKAKLDEYTAKLSTLETEYHEALEREAEERKRLEEENKSGGN